MSSNFGKFAIELGPLINVRIEFLLNILKTNRPIKTKICIHIIVDRIYVGNINHCFSQICNRVTALDCRQNLVFAQYLETNRQFETKFCIHIIIDKFNISIVNLCFSQICNRVTTLG